MKMKDKACIPLRLLDDANDIKNSFKVTNLISVCNMGSNRSLNNASITKHKFHCDTRDLTLERSNPKFLMILDS